MEAKTIDADNNHIRLMKMDVPQIVGTFMHILYNITAKHNFKEVYIDCSELEGAIYPNVLVPLAGIVEYYKKQGIKFEFINLPDTISRTNFHSPLLVSENSATLSQNALNVVWKYETDNDTNELSKALLRSISQEIICEEGIIDALLWCMNEIMDNVLVHSESSCGFVMGQVHRRTRHIAICVYDYGKGIFNSLKDTEHRPKSAAEAIELAIQERVTRDKKVGQGNGMWGLSEIVKNNAGQLTIISGSGFYMRNNGNSKTLDNFSYLSPEHGACLVDFQLNYTRPISLASALKGHKPVNYRTESFEDDNGAISFRLADFPSGTGTRESGKRIRTDLINLFNDTRKGIIIDFADLTVISSSFADELVGKLLVHFGFMGFNQIVRMKNMNQTIQSIVERSVAQRMTEAFT